MKTSDKRIGMAALAKSSGFTMVELMMTIAIGSIVLMLAVPSFRYVTNSNRIAAEINGLLGDLQFARAEAIKEGRTVTVCVSSNGSNCLNPNPAAWQNGWIVFSDPAATGVPAVGSVLRVQKPFSGTDTFTASPNTLTSVTFNREGYAAGTANGTLITLQDSTHTSAWTRCLTLSLVGQVTTEKAGDPATNGATCT
jgi:type IV fimbrial biogenesis protein FimT